MENPPGGENKQPQKEPDVPVFVHAPEADHFANSTIPQGAANQPYTNNYDTIILQWLMYAFWGWTVLAFSFLAVSTFEYNWQSSAQRPR